MKKLLLTTGILFTVLSSYCQVAADEAAILKQILDLPDMQQYYPKKTDGSLKQHYIMNNTDTFSDELSAVLDVSRVEFRSSEAIKAGMIPAYFAFRILVVDTATATATVDYFYNYNYNSGEYKVLTINIDLQKSGNNWSVLAHVIDGDI